MKYKKDKKITVIIISILIVVILVFAITYAYFSTELLGSDQIVKVGELELVLNETSEGIGLDNAVGISDREGISLTPSTFELVNNGSKAVDYTIYLDDNTIGETDTRIDDMYLKYNLNKNGTDSGALFLTRIGTNPNRVLDSGTIEGGGTNTYSLNLWITDEVDGNYSGQVFSGKLRVEVSQEKTAAEYLIAHANDEDLNYYEASSDEQKEMWEFSHDATEQTTALTDYRYIGNNPSNYVTFNNETWRIIGVFSVDDGTGNVEERLKLIRDESIGYYSWDNKTTTSGAETDYGKNNWPDARLNYLLNPFHEDEEISNSLYWNRKSGKCYTQGDNYVGSCDFTNTGLTPEAREMIGDSLWYLGAIRTNNSASVTPIDAYTDERGNQAYDNTRQTLWIGKVGLVYASDYGYATSGGSTESRESCLYKDLFYWKNDECSQNNWLYKADGNWWTITPYSHTSNDVIGIYSNGTALNYLVYSGGCAVYPTVYLKSSVKIISGKGTSDNPYILRNV